MWYCGSWRRWPGQAQTVVTLVLFLSPANSVVPVRSRLSVVSSPPGLYPV
jgi:hypothetical protein